LQLNPYEFITKFVCSKNKAIFALMMKYGGGEFGEVVLLKMFH
jgi:hypothetical protein